MFLSRWSVQRPIAMTALIIILVMIGLNFYPKISIDLLPNMEIPTVLVRCEYQGASPTEIEVEIAKRIEDAVSSLDGIRHITSVSIEDEARIQLEFNMGTNVDIAATVSVLICPTARMNPQSVKSTPMRQLWCRRFWSATGRRMTCMTMRTT